MVVGHRMAAVIVVAVCASAAALAQESVTPAQAIAAAVVRLVGEGAAVEVLDLRTAVSPEPGLIAEPEPAARFGKRARFLLSAGGARRGLAVATVKAIAAVPRARRAIARDEVIGGDAVDLSAGALTPLHIRALPSAGDVVGLTARRDIAPGEVLIAAVLRRPPLVRSGDEVTASLRVGAVVVTAVGHASGSGQAGDVIRVSQPNSSRLLKGRITGPGAVEIVE